MKFSKRYTKKTVFMAMVHGVIIGVAAIAIIGFIILGANGKKVGEKPTPEVPATGPPANEEGAGPQESQDGSLKLIARQHGAFSSSASAATFMEADPSLTTAAIIQVAEQYYVWSAVGLTEAEIMDSDSEDTFRKEFSVTSAACDVAGAEKLGDVLLIEDIAKIKSLESEKDNEKAAEFTRDVVAITSFTNDLRVIRLHLLSHYSTKKDCVKISF